MAKGFGARERRNLVAGLAFLTPNILGVLTFVIFPVAFSVVMTFTDWDLTKHNMFLDASPEFVGLLNFERLFEEPYFVEALGNTLFLMMGIPFAIAGSLLSALLLSGDTRGGSGRVFGWMMATALLVAGVSVLAAIGAGGTAMMVLLVGIASFVLVIGMAGGRTVYRTLFYAPHFTAGVATFLLWKKLYNPSTGPINSALRPVLDGVEGFVASTPSGTAPALGLLLAAGSAALCWVGLGRLRRRWVDGEAGHGSVLLGSVLLCLPAAASLWWMSGWGVLGPVSAGVLLAGACGIGVAFQVWRAAKGRDFRLGLLGGLGNTLMLSLLLMTGQFILVGLALSLHRLPGMASDGLESPAWIADYHWAKPSLMIMGLWAAVGSNNMLLYLAALTNIPGELYEAANIDGASPTQKFWNVTWPQLAPTTFFISVMAVIHGLQGGFEMARTMTEGGPAGATTTLSYLVYQQGFQEARLGYACAIAWALFILVFSVTLFNWKFGNSYVND